MAVRFINNFNHGLIGFWEITESSDQLFGLLQPKEHELIAYLALRNEQRKKEWLSVRLLLQKMISPSAKIGYYPDRKPYLVHHDGHISISHSGNSAVIFYHPFEYPGIDIEQISRNIERVAKKFLSPNELANCLIDGEISNVELILRWCAKEAVFKIVPYSDVDFANQITCICPPVTTDNGSLKCIFTTGKISLEVPLEFQLTGDTMMVWGSLSI